MITYTILRKNKIFQKLMIYVSFRDYIESPKLYYYTLWICNTLHAATIDALDNIHVYITLHRMVSGRIGRTDSVGTFWPPKGFDAITSIEVKGENSHAQYYYWAQAGGSRPSPNSKQRTPILSRYKYMCPELARLPSRTGGRR
jgi:hypothetical protein